MYLCFENEQQIPSNSLLFLPFTPDSANELIYRYSRLVRKSHATRLQTSSYLLFAYLAGLRLHSF